MATEIDRLSNALSEADDRISDMGAEIVATRTEADELRSALTQTKEALIKWQDRTKRLEAADAARKERARVRAEQRKAAPVRYCFYWCSNPECSTAWRYIFHKGDPRFSHPTRLTDRCEACEGVIIWVAAAENVDEVEGIAREARAYISVILGAPDEIDAYLDAIIGSDTWRGGGPAQEHLDQLADRFYAAHDAETGNEFLVRSTTREMRRALLWLILTGELPGREAPDDGGRPSWTSTPEGA